MKLLAAMTGVIIAVIPPATYFTIGWAEQKVSADYMSREVSQKLRETVKANPGLWKFSVVKFTKVFDEVETKEIAEIRILDAEGALLADTAFPTRARLVRTGSSDILYNNIRFGRVELDKSADSTLSTTALLFLGFSALAALVSLALFRYPAAIVRSAEGSINATIDSLNREVVERTRKEMVAGESLREKEILLKEIHHRVKNNLQIIISLINLQLHNAEPGKASDMLHGIKHRVNTMALVHERLYDSPTLSLIDMGEYIKSLVVGYLDSFESEAVTLNYEVDVEGISLSLDYAMPIGLIICELVINSLKYAFKGRSSGFIGIGLRRTEDGALRLTVWDDGIGIPEPAAGGVPSGYAQDDADSGSLGLQLVRALSKQIRGKLSMVSASGLKVTVDGIRVGAN